MNGESIGPSDEMVEDASPATFINSFLASLPLSGARMEQIITHVSIGVRAGDAATRRRIRVLMICWMLLVPLVLP